MYHRILHTFLLLSLGILLGALLFFGLGVAGILFNPELIPSRTLSGALNTRILERLVVLASGAGVLSLGAFIPLYFTRPRQANLTSGVLLLILAGILIYLSLFLFPEADALRTSIGSFDPVLPSKSEIYARFQSSHERFSLLTKFASLLAFVAFVSHVVALDSKGRKSAASNPVERPETKRVPEQKKI